MPIRLANKSDLEHIIEMLANDPLGMKRESMEKPLIASYFKAFEHISNDPNHQVIVYEESESIVGTLQLSFLPNLTYKGSWRAQIEGVRVKENAQGKGVGKQMIQWAIDEAKKRKAYIIQLTTDKQRPAALQFYEQLGFTPSHEGMKLKLISQ